MSDNKTTTKVIEDGDSSATCSTPDPIAVVKDEHILQLELCDLLEAIADDLPSAFDRSLAVIAVSILQGSVEAHTKFEDEALFPLLRSRLGADDPVVNAMTCLSEEHSRDEEIVRELTDALRAAIATGIASNPETLGYVLRGYFESQRRHIAWEDRVIIPAAMTALTLKDLVALQHWIMNSEHPRCSRQSLMAIRAARSGHAVCNQCPSSAGRSNVQRKS